MRHFRLGVVGLCALLAFSAPRAWAQEPAAAGAAVPVDPIAATIESIVVVHALDENGKPFSRRTGIVTTDRCVLTSLVGLTKAHTTRIVTRSGRELPVTGVAAHRNGSAGIVLLSVDWGGEAPPVSAALAPAPAPRHANVTILLADPDSPKDVQRIPCRIGRQPFEYGTIDLEDSSVKERRVGGAPVVDETGMIVGIVNGFHVGISVGENGVGAPSGLTAISTSIARGMSSRTSTTWEEWKQLGPRLQNADELGRQAVQARKDKKYDEAIAAATECTAIDAQSTIAWETLGSALAAKGQYEKALAALDRAIELEPSRLFAGRMRTFALQSLHRYNAAMDESDRLVQLAPDDAEVLAERGGLFLVRKQWLEARGAFQRALELNPKKAELVAQIQSIDDYAKKIAVLPQRSASSLP